MINSIGSLIYDNWPDEKGHDSNDSGSIDFRVVGFDEGYSIRHFL